jgi:hypothetical protein
MVAAVPTPKASVTVPSRIPACNSDTDTRRSSVGMPKSFASVRTESRVIPAKIESLSTGVVNTPSMTNIAFIVPLSST